MCSHKTMIGICCTGMLQDSNILPVTLEDKQLADSRHHCTGYGSAYTPYIAVHSVHRDESPAFPPLKARRQVAAAHHMTAQVIIWRKATQMLKALKLLLLTTGNAHSRQSLNPTSYAVTEWVLHNIKKICRLMPMLSQVGETLPCTK